MGKISPSLSQVTGKSARVLRLSRGRRDAAGSGLGPRCRCQKKELGWSEKQRTQCVEGVGRLAAGGGGHREGETTVGSNEGEEGAAEADMVDLK